jgi:hypothetical protein
MGLFADEQDALEHVRTLVAEDLSYEHFSAEAAKDETWRFAVQAWLEPAADVVAEFTARYARTPVERVCFLPLQWLTVKHEMSVFGIRLLPLDAIDVPGNLFGPEAWVTSGCVVAVSVRGTDHRRMAHRAYAIADPAIRRLRVALRGADRWIADEQLRFRLRPGAWFDDGASAGTAISRDDGWELELDDRLLGLALTEPIADLPGQPGNNVGKCVDRALSWYERAQLTSDPITGLLYLFFALEAILGDKEQGLKGHKLALRRAILGLVTTGAFAHPSRTYLLYNDVRSAAVHGEQVPEVGNDVVDAFRWDIRNAINEFVQFARDNELFRRVKICRALDANPRRARVLTGLTVQDPESWGEMAEPERGDTA